MSLMLICDKSVLEMLNREEAVLLQKYFYTNVTPVLFLEVVADLKETPKSETLTAEQRVAMLAERLPVGSFTINAHHVGLIKGELFSGCFVRNTIPLRGQAIPAAKPRVIETAERGVVHYYDESQEEKALRAWREQKFSELDGLLAHHWKMTQKNVDISSMADIFKQEFSKAPKFADLAAVKDYVDTLLANLNQRMPRALFNAMVGHFGASSQMGKDLLNKWNALNRASKRVIAPQELAPYSHYVFSVDLFFRLALSQRLIASSKSSKSNIDIQYLYYLPFTTVFVSNDNFHKKVTPFFLRQNQTFIDGQVLKTDLKQALVHLKGLAEEAASKRNSNYPPQLDNSILCFVYDQYAKGWREREPQKIEISKEQNDKIMKQLKLHKDDLKNARPYSGGGAQDDPKSMVIERLYTRQQMKEHFGLSDEKVDEIIRFQKAEAERK